MGVQKRRRMAKTTRQAKRVKTANSKHKKRKLEAPMAYWDKKKSLRQNYAKMGILHDFDAQLNAKKDNFLKLSGVRGTKGAATETEYETVKNGYFAKKRREKQQTRINGKLFIEELQARALNPKKKKPRFNISMEEIQCIERIVAKLGKRDSGNNGRLERADHREGKGGGECAFEAEV